MLAPETRIAGHGDAARSTGQPGAASTVPCTTAVDPDEAVMFPQAASVSVATRMSRPFFTPGSTRPPRIAFRERTVEGLTFEST